MSTIVFADFIRTFGGTFYSCDADADAVRAARRTLSQRLLYTPSVVIVRDDSVRFLRRLRARVDLLYMDSLDFDSSRPLISQLHHLNEAAAALPQLRATSAVLIDDCALRHGGKGGLASGVLKAAGYKEAIRSYQVLFERCDRALPYQRRSLI